jgi:hypothetical protein
MHTVGHSKNEAVIEKSKKTIGLILWGVLLKIKTAWARLSKTLPLNIISRQCCPLAKDPTYHYVEVS